MPAELRDHVRALVLAFDRQRGHYVELRSVLTSLKARLAPPARNYFGRDFADPGSGVDRLLARQQEALNKIEMMDRHIRFLREKAAKCLSVDDLTLGALRRAAASGSDRDLAAMVSILDTLTQDLVDEAKAVSDLAARVESELARELRAIKGEIDHIAQGKRLIKAYRSMGAGVESRPRFLDEER